MHARREKKEEEEGRGLVSRVTQLTSSLLRKSRLVSQRGPYTTACMQSLFLSLERLLVSDLGQKEKLHH